MRRRLLAMIMAVTMVISILPATAMAEGPVDPPSEDESAVVQTSEGETSVVQGVQRTYATIANAIGAGEDSVTLIGNLQEDVVIDEGEKLTLNLGGFVLSEASSHTISNKGTLVIEGTGTVKNTIASVGALANYPSGEVTLNGGTFENTGWYTIKNLGTMTINEGVEVKTTDAGSSLIDTGWYGNTGNDLGLDYTQADTVTLTINGGTFTGGMNTIKNDDYGVLLIKDGTFQNKQGAVVLNWNEATIEGGSFTGNAGSSPVIANSYINNTADKGQLTITGGTFTAPEDSALFGFAEDNNPGGTTAIEGGKFYGTIGSGFPYELDITGGTYYDDVDGVEAYLPDGYTTDESGQVGPTTDPGGDSVASVTKDGVTQYFKTLSGAIATAGDGDTVTLMTSTDLTVPVTIDNDITFDLGGKTLTLKGNTDGTSALGLEFTSEGDSVLRNGTIIDNRSNGNQDCGFIAVQLTGDGTLTTENLTVKTYQPDSDANYNYLLRVEGGTGTLTLKTGTVLEEVEQGDPTSDITYGAVGVAVLGTQTTDTTKFDSTTNLVIEDDVRITTTGFAISGNGSDSNGTNITIHGGEISSLSSQGIYHPQYGTLTIDGGTVTGVTGIEMRSGELNVSGDAVIVGTGEPITSGPNGNGSTTSGAGIAVVQHTTKLPITVEITGGEIRGYNALYQDNTQENEDNAVEKITLAVEGGDFLATDDDGVAVYSKNKQNFISGGTFSTDVSSYVVEGAKWDETTQGIVADTSESTVAIIDNIAYDDLATALEAAQDGDTVKLMKSTTNNTSVSISDGRVITLDMNGFNAGFSSKKNISVFRGGLNITGSGKLYEESPWFAPVMIYGSKDSSDTDYTTVTVGEDVILEGWAGLFIDQHDSHPNEAYGIVVDVYGTLKSVKDTSEAGGHALYINGTIKATEGNVPKITLDGATLTTELGNGMYLAGYAETTIIDSSITSTGKDSTGIEIRAGKLSISGDTRIEASTGEVEVSSNGNGSTSANVAIAIAQHTTKLPIEVTVTGGTFIGGAALNEMNPEENEPDAIDQVEISVEGGNYIGIVNSENVDGFVSDGNFSKPVNHEYLIDTLNAELKKSTGDTPYSYYTDVDEALKYAQAGDTITDLSGQSGEPSEPVTVVTVSYNNGGHGTAPGSETITAGTTIPLPVMDNDGGWAFVGWNDGKETYQPGDLYTVMADTTFTAQWEQLVSGVLLDKSALTLYEGQEATLIATVMPEGAADKTVMWSSSDPMVATVDDDGVVTAIRDGSATITATTSNGMFDTCEVTVIDRPSRPSRPSGGSAEPSYTVSVEDMENGTVETDPRRAEEGEEVTITVTPDDGYELDTLTVTDRDGDEVEVTEERDGTYTFEMPDSRVTIEAIFVPVEEDIVPEIPADWANPYTDVAANAWYYDAVAYVTANGLMNGTSATTFAPDATTTRAMIWTVLARMNGQNVDGGTPWYALAQSWAVRANVSDGTNPTSPISREELATTLYRAAGSPAVSGNLLSYPDGISVSAWAESAMLWATQNGIISGIDGMLTPQGQATRAQVATMLMRFREVVIR